MESESAAAAALPPEQELTEALLSLSWPLPRTVEDADAALTRLEEVKAVLTRLEQQSVGGEAWWAGQVDGLATQSGFVLEWWRPVLRDPDLDWTLNHQAHLTADLAALASAGARLLDQIEPPAADEAAALHARRAGKDERWGPTAVPPFPPSGPKPQPPGQVFGQGGEDEPDAVEELDAPGFPPAPRTAVPAPGQPEREHPAPPRAYDAPLVAAPPSVPAQQERAPETPQRKASGAGAGPGAAPGAARHRRPVYDFDDAGQTPPTPPPAAFPVPAGPATRGPLVPGPTFGGPPQGRRLTPAGHPSHAPSAPALGPLGFGGQDDDGDEPDSLVTGGPALRRHQRRLLIQTGAILGAVGALCWLAVYALSSSPSHASAAGGASHPAGESGAASAGGTAAGGLTNPNPGGAPSKAAQPTPSPSTAASTAHPSAPDATTVSSVHVTLLGGSSAVPQIVALITVDTAGSGQVTVTGSYYGTSSGAKQIAPRSEQWVLSGKTAYQYSVPIANSAYCGTEFHLTISAGGHAESGETSPGC